MNWKVTSEKIAQRHSINTFDKLSYAQAKEIGFCYCVPYTNEEAMKELRKGQKPVSYTHLTLPTNREV